MIIYDPLVRMGLPQSIELCSGAGGVSKDAITVCYDIIDNGMLRHYEIEHYEIDIIDIVK